MAVQFDLSLAALRTYRPDLEAPDDFDDFWTGTLQEARQFDLAPTFTRADAGLPLLDFFDVRFSGWNGQSVAAWLLLPTGTVKPLPTIVEYIGYGGGRGLAHEHLLWANAGYAHLVVDTRGQGSATHSTGVT